jgi:hypothetical protein
MLQLSLHSGPERFTLGGGRSGSFIVLPVSYVSQHCSVTDVVITYVAGSSIYRISMAPAALLACLISSFICKQGCGCHTTAASKLSPATSNTDNYHDEP